MIIPVLLFISQFTSSCLSPTITPHKVPRMPEIEHILHSSVFNYDTMGQMTFHHTHRVRTTYTREMCHTDEWKVTNSNKSSNRLPFHRITNVTIFRYQNMSFIKNNNNTRDGMAFVIVIKLMHTLFIHFTPQQRQRRRDDIKIQIDWWRRTNNLTQCFVDPKVLLKRINY